MRNTTFSRKSPILYLFVVLFVYSLEGQNKAIEVTYKQKSDFSVEFRYTKNLPGSYYVLVEFTRLENSNSNTTVTRIIKNQTGALFTLRPANPNQSIGFSYSVRYTRGNPNPRLKNEVTYVLPFKPESKVQVMEASNLGERYFDSDEPDGWKAFVVFSANPKTIYAMRKGIVVKIIDDQDNNPMVSKTYTSKTNSIIIEHDNGTYSYYSGFDDETIRVEEGQTVYPHTHLGQLAMFNLSQYRLDFYVYYNSKNLLDDSKENSFTNKNLKSKFLNPIFYTKEGTTTLQSGQFYTSSIRDDVRLQEFSRRERKRYKKNPSDFY